MLIFNISYNLLNYIFTFQGLDDAMKKRIYIAYTGGTIGMRRTGDGYVPEAGLARLIAEMIPARLQPELPDYVVYEYDHLIDSANIRPRDWRSMAGDIIDRYREFDGFVILHGTDTMAYTASALSFILRGLRKPVIITGSQIPLHEMRNDGHNNLLTALLLAANESLSEVCLYFNGRLLRGNRATKVKAEGLDAFDSPNYPELGRAGIHLEVDDTVLLRNREIEAFHLPNYDDGKVAVLRLFPGITSRFLSHLLEPPLQGLIMQSYGVGNAPVIQSGFLDVLSGAIARGVVVVNVSQCLQGRVDLGQYAAGSALINAGVISGLDMTTEAAVTKLNHLLAMGLARKDVCTSMTISWCGECTVSAKPAA
jgi:L-asparaginase